LLTRRFSAFGAPIDATLCFNGPTSDANPRSTFTDHLAASGFFYVGQEYDASTGLQYSRARYYDPVSSEFISQDPLGFAGGDTNLYRRAGNSPANATDPSGMIINVGTAAAGAGIGAVIGGGFYLVSNYVSGRDFSLSDFAIATASGAVSGAVAGATGGASLLAQAASGAAAGAAGGAVYGGATSYAAGGSLQQVAGNAASGAAVGAVAGLAGGAVTGRLLGANPAAAILGQRVTANAAGGATAGAIGGGFDGYMHTGTLAGTLEGAATGLVYGGVVAGGLTAGSAAVRRAFAPIGVTDFSQSTGRLGGELYGEVRLGKLSRYLERRNVKLVRDADARIDALNPNGNGVFIANRNGPSELLLRRNATRAQVLHELSHFRHMKRVEFDDYIRAGRLGREQTVYDTIKNNRYWSQMTQAERDAAFDYIFRLGGNPFGGGRP
jgi:RHS repeat-associated protein